MRARALPALLLALALIGLAIAIYLTVAHYQNTALACANTALINCEAVTHSSYSLVPGTSIPITVPIFSGVSAAAVTPEQ